MNYAQYKQWVDEILNHSNPAHPYNDEAYLNYTKLNRSRMHRWDQQLVLSEDLVTQLKQVSEPQHWIIISEPWCGDAAHIVPFLVRMAEQNEKIRYDIQLRDSEPHLIESYLTNGTKSIPKLIVRDKLGNDLFVWGPRPKEAQQLVDTLKAENTDFEATKVALQHWYNHDAGKLLCEEVAGCLLNAKNQTKVLV